MSSVSDLITKAKHFDADTVSYKPASVNKRGGKNVSCTIKNSPIVLQFPLMLCWGVNERVDENSGRVSYDLSLDFRNETSATRAMLANLKKFEKKIKDDCVRYCKEWFGKSKMSAEVVDAMFYPILKYPKKKDDSGEPDYDRSPSLKLKLSYWEGKFTSTEVYNHADNSPLYLPPKDGAPVPDRTPVDLIPKASHLSGLFRCSGLWFAGGRCGVTWQLLQAKVRPPARLLGSGTCQMLDDSDDEEMEEQIKAKEAEESTVVNDDEDEDEDTSPTFDDDDDEEEAEPEPEPEPVKKKVKKVKKIRKKN